MSRLSTGEHLVVSCCLWLVVICVLVIGVLIGVALSVE
jgi:MFS superfamily sulfate permease-like transporter